MREISSALEQGAVDDYLSPAYHNHRAYELTAVAAG
jgi:hypothetical protein